MTKNVDRLRVGIHPVDVIEHDEAIKDERDDECDALWDPSVRPRAIRFRHRAGESDSEIWKLIFHEFTHGVLDVRGIALPKAYEEAVCDAIGEEFARAFSDRLGPPPGRSKPRRRRNGKQE